MAEQEKKYLWTNDPLAVNLGVEIDNNKQGASGEAFFCSLFAQGNMCVEFLGDKAPDVDCFVSFNSEGHKYEFLVQVKSTGDLNECEKTVNSGITRDEYERLCSYHLPTYLARVDMGGFKIYMKAAYLPAEKCTYSMVSKKYVLSFDTLKESREIMNGIATDVRKYWDGAVKSNYKATFNSYFENERA